MSKSHFPILRREFSPREAEHISGVSVTLQRDWRRRGLLPEQISSGWAKFSLSDTIEMFVMKSFSDSGFSVQSTREFSHKAVAPTMKALFSYPDAIDFEGYAISPKLEELVTVKPYAKVGGRYLAISRGNKSGKSKILQCDDFTYIDNFLEDADAVHFTVVDCERIAKTIATKVGLPIARYAGLQNDEGR